MTPFNSTGSLTAESLPPLPAAAAETLTFFVHKLLHELHAVELFLALLLFITIHSLRQRKPQGLPSWPLVGMLPSLIFALNGDNIYEWLTEVLRRRGGTFTFRGPAFTSLHCVLTADPRNLEHILKTRFPSFPKGPYFRDAVRDLLGEGIFGVDGEAWRRQRRAASLEFHSAGFRAMTAESLNELVHGRLIPVLDGVCETKEAVDLQDVLLRLTFDNVCMIAFGADPGCLSPGLPNIPFAKAFEEATEATVVRFVTPTAVWRALRFLRLGHERKLRDCLRDVDEFAYGVIQTRKKELQSADPTVADEDSASNPSWKRNKSDLLTVFLKGRDEDGREYGEEFLRDVCVNFILAGRDTSSVALAWFFWLLDSHREVEQEVLRELCGILAQRNDKETEEGEVLGSADHREVVFRPEELKKMEYLQAALSEALRLYPSVPVDHKEVMEDEVFPDGTVLKKGTKVIYAIYAMGRMESIWGDDCLEFRPNRWLKDGRFVSESAYRFSAFNGGPRLCLGKDFAYYQMKFVAAAMLLRYRVRVVPGHPVAPKLALTMYMKHGLRVTLEKREAGELAR